MTTAAAVQARGGMSVDEARAWLVTEHVLKNNSLARDALASLTSGEPLSDDARLWLEAHAENSTVNSERARLVLSQVPAKFGWSDLLSNHTHDVDDEGNLKQLVSPEELRDLLKQHGVGNERPSMFLDSDEWQVAP